MGGRGIRYVHLVETLRVCLGCASFSKKAIMGGVNLEYCPMFMELRDPAVI